MAERGRRCCALALICGALSGPPGALAQPPPDAPAASFDRATALLRAGDTAAAERLLRSVVEARPRHAAARVLLGRIALERGELGPAREHLEIATASRPPRPYLAWHLLGRVQLLLGEPGTAMASWERSLEHAPRFVPALLGRARASLRLEALEPASRDLERIRSLAGAQPEATLLLAELRLFQGRSDEATLLLQELTGPAAAAADPATPARLLLLAASGRREDLETLRRLVGERLDQAAGLLSLAVARLGSEDPGAASHALRAALEIDDQDPVPWLFLRRLLGDAPAAAYPAPYPELASTVDAARGLQERSGWSEAAALLEPILERRPHHLPARLLLLRDAERRDDRWAALAGYRRLLEWLPGLPALELRAATLARSMGALELAACLANRARRALPDDGSVHLLLAAIHNDAGRFEATADSCRRALALGLEEAPVYLALGLAEFERMRIQESIAAYARALELDPEAIRAVPRFALASLTGGELAALRRLLELRLATAAEDENALYGLGALSLRENELDSARAYFERLANLTPDDPRVLYQLGTVYLRLGDEAPGAAAMERFAALKAAQDRRWLEHNRAHSLRLEAQRAAAAGDAGEALRIYAELAAAGTADQDDYLAAGRACLGSGDFRRAYGWFDQVLVDDPYRPEALRGLAEAAEGLGRADAARLARDRLALLSWPCSAAEPQPPGATVAD